MLTHEPPLEMIPSLSLSLTLSQLSSRKFYLCMVSKWFGVIYLPMILCQLACDQWSYVRVSNPLNVGPKWIVDSALCSTVALNVGPKWIVDSALCSTAGVPRQLSVAPTYSALFHWPDYR